MGPGTVGSPQPQASSEKSVGLCDLPGCHGGPKETRVCPGCIRQRELGGTGGIAPSRGCHPSPSLILSQPSQFSIPTDRPPPFPHTPIGPVVQEQGCSVCSPDVGNGVWGGHRTRQRGALRPHIGKAQKPSLCHLNSPQRQGQFGSLQCSQMP